MLSDGQSYQAGRMMIAAPPTTVDNVRTLGDLNFPDGLQAAEAGTASSFQ